ncbi:MAG: hypothetical protein KAY24_05645, partial [Candidatus Eisenbacteria sp.]|nr:hypothetical protein [Candidatus Eisenbacteria bacterium]
MPQQGEGRLHPVLFVGLGSTGAKIISKIKPLLDDGADEFANRFYRYLRVTSEIDPEPGVDRGIASIALATRDPSPRDAVEVLAKHADSSTAASFESWWHRDAPDSKDLWIPPGSSTGRGSGGVRATGRLLLHYYATRGDVDIAARFAAVRAELEESRNNQSLENQARVSTDRIDCYIFGLLAGGTCSGTLQDLAYLAREGLGDCNLFGVFLLGDICYGGANSTERQPLKMETQRRNTSFALAEMTLLNSQTGIALAKQHWVRRVGGKLLGDLRFDHSPYHSITLIGAKNESGFYLERFSDYQDFVAEYYSNLYATETNACEVGRVVDEEAAHALTADVDFPSRPNNLDRIGLLSVRVPYKKILLLISQGIGEELATRHFKNGDEARWPRLVQAFKNTVLWESIENSFQPPSEDITTQELDPFPQSSEEFNALFTQMREDIDAYYGPWHKVEAPKLRARLVEFQQEWASAIDEMLTGVLGHAAEDSFSMGDLGSALKTLIATVEDRRDNLTEMAVKAEQRLYGAGDASLSKVFDVTLQEMVEEFPKPNIVKKIFGRKWSGAEDVSETLGRYARELRSCATLRATAASLNPLANELRALSVVHQLICNVVMEVVQQRSRAADECFKERNDRRSFRLELIDRRDEIRESFVDEILDATCEGGDQPSATDPTGTKRVTVRDRCRFSIIDSWRGEGDSSLLDVARMLLALLRDREDLRTPDAALRLASVSGAIRGLDQGLTRAFDQKIRDVVQYNVDRITVWEAIRKYVSQLEARTRGKDAQSILHDLFGVL